MRLILLKNEKYYLECYLGENSKIMLTNRESDEEIIAFPVDETILMRLIRDLMDFRKRIVWWMENK